MYFCARLLRMDSEEIRHLLVHLEVTGSALALATASNLRSSLE